MILVNIKKQKVSMKMLLLHCYTDHEDALKNKNVKDIQWIKFKVKIMEEELIKSTKFLNLALMTKFMFLIIELVR